MSSLKFLLILLFATTIFAGEPSIKQFRDQTSNGPGPLDGYYYISRDRTLTPFEIYQMEASAGPVNPKIHEFLHQDGRWRTSTHFNGWSGYYKTKEDAKKILEKYNSKP